MKNFEEIDKKYKEIFDKIEITPPKDSFDKTRKRLLWWIFSKKYLNYKNIIFSSIIIALIYSFITYSNLSSNTSPFETNKNNAQSIKTKHKNNSFAKNNIKKQK